MTQVLNLSDYHLILSDEHSRFVIHSPAQTPPPARARPASDRTDTARLADRDLQALRPAQLPLCRWTRARPQAISFHNQSNRRAPAGRLRAECSPRRSPRVPRQLPQIARGAPRDLRDQCRTSAPPRESRLDGPGGVEAEAVKAVFADVERQGADGGPEQRKRENAGGKSGNERHKPEREPEVGAVAQE